MDPRAGIVPWGRVGPVTRIGSANGSLSAERKEVAGQGDQEDRRGTTTLVTSTCLLRFVLSQRGGIDRDIGHTRVTDFRRERSPQD